MGALSPWHIAIFVVVVLVVFGPKRLPEMGRSLGKGMREFKDSIAPHASPEGPEEPRSALVTETAAEVPAAVRDRDAL